MSRVGFTLLTNYAEDNGGLLYLQGGGWDTITVNGPLENGPEGAFTLIRGFFVARLQFHPTEAGREHSFTVVIVDADGGEVLKVEGNLQVGRAPGLPASWMQSVNIILPLTGAPLPKPGLYRISLLINGSHEADHPFRVIKAY